MLETVHHPWGCLRKKVCRDDLIYEEQSNDDEYENDDLLHDVDSFFVIDT